MIGKRMRAVFAKLLIVGLVSFISIYPASATIPSDERNALREIYLNTDGAAWTNFTNWNGEKGTECTWFGVTCNAGDLNVVQINLDNNHLVGVLPYINALTSLERLNVDNNLLSGNIHSFWRMSALRQITLAGNQFTGAIPPFDGLTALQILDLRNNRLTGTLPSLVGLKALETLDLSGNKLTGSIPSLRDLNKLRSLRLGNNQLTGLLPAPPLPNVLSASASSFCPNMFTITTNATWNAATRITPWSRDCVSEGAADAVSTPSIATWAALPLMALAILRLARVAVRSFRSKRRR